MKTIDLIPKDIIEMYDIKQTSELLMIHKPNPIGMTLDGEVKVSNDEIGTTLSMRGAIITLYKDARMTHITVLT